MTTSKIFTPATAESTAVRSYQRTNDICCVSIRKASVNKPLPQMKLVGVR